MNNNKAKEICNRVGKGIPYVMILSYILDKGQTIIKGITDEQIENVEKVPMMERSLVQGIMRTAREVVLNCDQSDIVRLFKSDWCCAGEVYDPDLDQFVTDTEADDYYEV